MAADVARDLREGEQLIRLRVNGRSHSGIAEPRTLLSDFLRHTLGLTGTHVGCEHGVCGACTVRVDGVAARSCLMLAVQADGRAIDTVEGLAPREGLGDLQEAFRRHHALQCGFCTAGILMSCADYLERVPEPTEAQVRDMLSGHLCRCTGYTPIVAAVLDVAASRARARHVEATTVGETCDA
jgi:2-furoyl-CoA dehydrogenase 2Fe-2S iron sulfur subunit